MSPFTRRAERPAERYPLHNTPERESRRSGVTSIEVAEERSAAEELQRMREEHAALLSSIEAQHAAQPLPEAQPSPPPQQPMPSPQLRIIAQTQLTQAAVTQQASRQRRSGSKNCSNKELLSLLRTIQRVLPIGPEMWEMVAQLPLPMRWQVSENKISSACHRKAFYWQSQHVSSNPTSQGDQTYH